MNPCKECPNRSATCHAECKDYKKFAADRAAKNAEIKKKREKNWLSNDFLCGNRERRAEKFRKKHGGRR